MPNWTDDAGNCRFDVGGVPCYESGVGCPMHRVKQTRRSRSTRQADIDAAFRRGVNAAADELDRLLTERKATAIWVGPDELRALPDPEDKS